MVRSWQVFVLTLVYFAVVYFAAPNFISNNNSILPNTKLNLGLDLRGGSQLLLQVDFENYLTEQYENLLKEIRKEFKANKITYLSLKNEKNKLSLEIRDETKKEVEKVLDSYFKQFTYDKNSNLYKISFNDEHLAGLQKNLIEQSIEIVRRRVDEIGVTEPSIQPRGLDKIDLQVPGLSSPEQLKKILGKTAKLTFHLVNEEIMMNGREYIPSDSFVSHGYSDNYSYVLKRESLLSGNELTDARAVFNQSMPAVSFQLNQLGGKKFAEITKQNSGKRFAIVLDNKVISAPVIQEPILTGSGVISGHFTIESANELALLLRAGALPAQLLVLEERTVGPSLGADSIEAGKLSGLIALVLVSVFMFVCYGSLGIFANISLIMNMLFIIAALSLLQATLTLPGIAAIVLTIGMAVDANILIFERIREEIKNGHNLTNSIISGFKNAFSAILDSNITTIIVALLLYIFGTGPIKGFAVSLSIGIIASMVSNIVLTKTLLLLWVTKFNIKKIKV